MVTPTSYQNEGTDQRGDQVAFFMKGEAGFYWFAGTG
jgi:hypothetical protein